MLCWAHTETSHIDFDIRISASSVLRILNGFGVNMWELFSCKVLFVIQAWKTDAAGFELSTRLFHLVKSSIVIIDVSISASTVWLVDNTTIIVVLLSVVILWSTNGRTKGLMRYVSEILGITKHF